MNKNLLMYATALLVGSSLVLTSCKKDEEAPVITLSGGDTQTVVLNSTPTAPSATANDNKDGDLTSNVTSDYSSVVNKDSAGTYTVTYKVMDEASNEGTKTLTVNVVNEAAVYFEGTYNGSEVDAIGPYTYSGNSDASKTVTLTASKTKNNRVWMTRLGDFANNKNYFDVTGNSIDLPLQTSSNIGTGSTSDCSIASHKFSGTGEKISGGFKLTYDDEKVAPCSGTRIDVIATFTKK